MNISPHMAKSARYTMGARIENKFLDLLELSYNAYYSKKEEKTEKISKCIFILDTLKYLIATAWEAKLISHNQSEEIAQKLEEVGRMLGGWKNSLKNPEKKNRPALREGRDGKENAFGSEKLAHSRVSTCCQA